MTQNKIEESLVSTYFWFAEMNIATLIQAVDSS